MARSRRTATPEPAPLWGEQTALALANFPVSGQRLPARFIQAIARIKQAAAEVHGETGVLPARRAAAIAAAARAIAEGEHAGQFPLDVFQTGSATSTHMNVNEVIATLAARRLRAAVSANDEVNLGQSSNDTIPSAIHLAALEALREELLPALAGLRGALRRKGRSLSRHTKTGRTHLMDALPIRLDQEFGAWASQIEAAEARLRAVRPRLSLLAQGGTAIGSGVNAPPGFARAVCRRLSTLTGERLRPHPDPFLAVASQDTALELSAQLRGVAVVLRKIAEDLRWMNAGPLAGLGEIRLPTLQPGSSIMPGKVNPVIPEAVLMVVSRVMGLDTTLAWAAAGGNFQLNTQLPLIAHDLLQAMTLLASAARLLATRAVAGLSVRGETLERALARNPILVTALNPVIGYARGAAIARRAYAEDRPLIEIAREDSGLSEAVLQRLLDPRRLTGR